MSRNSNYFTGLFSQWLLDHPDLSKHIQIDAIPHNLTDEERQQKIAQIEMKRQLSVIQIDKLKRNEFDISTFKKPGELSPPPEDSANRAVWINHILYFVKIEIFKMKIKYANEVRQKCEAIIKLLTDPDLVPSSLDININENDLIEELKQEPTNVTKMKVYKGILASYYNKCISKPAEVNQLIQIMQNVLSHATLQIDRKTYYFTHNNIQQKFEQIIMSQNNPFKEEINQFLKTFQDIPRQQFTQKLVEIYTKLSQFFSITNPIEASCAVIMLFRVVFEKAYAIDPRYFYPNRGFGINTIAKRVPCEYIDLDTQFLPPHDPKEPIIDVFRRDRYYTQGSLHLTFAFLHTNPIDAIFEVHEMLMCIEKGATQRMKKTTDIISMFPFETTFGLYVGCMLASDVPSFEELGQFITDFAPTNGLCPEFEFAYTTTIACVDFCKVLYSNFG